MGIRRIRADEGLKLRSFRLSALADSPMAFGKSLFLWVTSSNGSAIALYNKCGFHRTGEIKPLAHAPSVAEYRMVRDLPRDGR